MSVLTGGAPLRHQGASEEHGWVVLCDPVGRNPNVSLNQVRERRLGRNRLHLDLYTDKREDEVKRLLKIGATRYPQIKKQMQKRK